MRLGGPDTVVLSLLARWLGHSAALLVELIGYLDRQVSRDSADQMADEPGQDVMGDIQHSAQALERTRSSAQPAVFRPCVRLLRPIPTLGDRGTRGCDQAGGVASSTH